jgi:hypothetical protein
LQCQGLRDHTVVTLPLENVGIGKVKGLLEHDLAAFPPQAVVADSKPDLPLAGLPVHNFEEHVPGTLLHYHKRIRHENGMDVGYILVSKNRVSDLGRGGKAERRVTGIDTDRPPPPLPGRSCRPVALLPTG